MSESPEASSIYEAKTDPNLGKGDISGWSRFRQNALMALDNFSTRGFAAKHVAPRRDKLQATIKRELEARGPGVLKDIPRRRNLTPEEFRRDFLLPGLPVVMEGMAKDWDCCKKWSMQYFADHYGDDELDVTTGAIQLSDQAVRKTTTLRDVIESENPSNIDYVRFHPMFTKHPELADDIPADWVESYKGPNKLFHQQWFFIGAKGTASGLHNSQIANLFVMAHGEKEWALYPTSYTAYVDPPVSRSVYLLSRHNTGVLYEPSMSQLDGYRVHLKEGDVLWNPPFYWHSVCNLTDTIGVGFRWNEFRLAFKMHPMMLLLDLFNTDPNWFEMFRTGRKERERDRERAAAKKA